MLACLGQLAHVADQLAAEAMRRNELLKVREHPRTRPWDTTESTPGFHPRDEFGGVQLHGKMVGRKEIVETLQDFAMLNVSFGPSNVTTRSFKMSRPISTTG